MQYDSLSHQLKLLGGYKKEECEDMQILPGRVDTGQYTTIVLKRLQQARLYGTNEIELHLDA